MFDIKIDGNDIVILTGRFDASQVEKAELIFADITQSKTIDLKKLDYISSAGIAIILSTQKRLDENGYGLKLINMNKHIRDIFRLSGLDRIFEIE